MHFNRKFFIILFVLLFINITVVCANDLNSTEELEIDEAIIIEEDILTVENNDDTIADSEDNKTVEKTTPSISIQSNNLKSKDSLEIYLKNSTGSPISSKQLSVTVDSQKKSIKTNSEGIATLPINLAAKNYKLTITFDGDDEYNSVSSVFDVKVTKLSTKFLPLTNFVVRGGYLYFYLYDQNWDTVSGKKITIKFNGKTYTKTTGKSSTRFKIKVPVSKYSIRFKFKGDNQFKASSGKFKVHVVKSLSFRIGNSKLLSNGYLRVYLKQFGKAVSKKTVSLKIGGKNIKQKTNSEGIVVFKPCVSAKTYVVTVKYGKYSVTKKLNCYEGNVKDPSNSEIPLKNGVPDIDVMPGNYVMGDENARYTLKKSQYKEVLKRDSYCLFLNNKLTKYTFFKTKSHPNLNHIVKREKWNVIEREINKKLVKANKKDYWPGKITVSLKGKSYTYPEVRDVQNTGYTCGPTSASVCSQVLKNYVCEKYLAKLGGTNKREGTTCSGIQKSLEKNNFKCTFYYKASFNNALNELKKGGTALVFHANRHYVAIIDISSDGKKVLVSNSYGTYDNIPTKWVKVSFMKKKFSHWEESLIVKLNYNLSNATIDSVNNYYHSMGANWLKHNTRQSIGSV